MLTNIIRYFVLGQSTHTRMNNTHCHLSRTEVIHLAPSQSPFWLDSPDHTRGMFSFVEFGRFWLGLQEHSNLQPLQ